MPTSPSLRRRFGSFAVAISLLALQLTPAVAAEITTDLWVYQYGDTVTVTGVDYAPDETVEIVTTDPNAVEVDRGTAQTDLYGGFTYAFTLTSDVPGIYDVVATGLSSGLSAATQFDPTTVSIDNAAFSWQTGAFTLSVSGKYSCSGSGGGTVCNDADDVTVEVRDSDSNNATAVGTIRATKVLTQTATGNNVAWSTTFAFPADFTLTPQGLYDIRAVFHGKNGATPVTSVEAVANDRFGFDNVKPASAVTSASPGANNVTAGGTASDATSGMASLLVQLYSGLCGSGTLLDSASVNSGFASWSKNLSGGGTNTPGGFCIRSTGTDIAGNVQTTTTDLSYVNDTPASVSATSPLNLATNVLVNSDIVVTFSEPVTVGNWLTVTCATSGGHAGATTGSGTATVTFNPTADFASNETCNVNVVAGQVTDVDNASSHPAANYAFSFTTAGSNTAPSVVVTGVANGGSYTKGSVPAAGCSVTDAEDGPSSFPATLSAITGSDAANGIGSQTASCSYTDAGGLTATASATYSITDGTSPSISYVLTPSAPDGSNGWFVSNVTLDWTVTEGDSPSTLVLTGCVDQHLTTDQAATNYSCSATSAGGNAGPVAVSIKIDKSAPVITDTFATTSPNGAGWYKTDVINGFSLNADISGPDTACALAFPGNAQTKTTSGEGLAVTVTSDGCTDNAGNAALGVPSGSFKIDKSAPVITDTFATTSPNGAGWYKTDVINGFSLNADISGPDTACALAFPGNAQTKTTSGEGLAVTVTSDGCTDNAGNAALGVPSGSFKIDKSAPVITDTFATTSPNGAGWYKTDVINGFSLNADISGPDTACALAFPGNAQTKTTSGEGLAVTVTSDGCTDNAGNAALGVPSGSFKIDKSAPTDVTFSGGGISEGGHYYFGSVPAGPSSCTANYAISGDAGCVVGGGGVTVGPHSFLGTATDKADNVAYSSLNYFVDAWTLKGFYQPVDMFGIYNTVKGGSTVPIKFEIFAGPTELTSVSDIFDFIVRKQLSCDSSVPFDEIEVTTSGATVLRYDSTGGQFIQNWQTPKGANQCYSVTMIALDGSSLVAYFKTK